MPWSGYTGSERDLAEAAEKYFNRVFENPAMKKSEPISPQLNWKPSLHFFNSYKHEIIAVEASETPYPAIFQTIRADLMAVQIPIVVYCICHEDTYLERSNQNIIKDLKRHGYGLLTVDDNSNVEKRNGCIPIIQHIPENEIETEIKELPKKIKVRIRDAFETYRRSADGGLSNLTEITESVVRDAGRIISNKNWINKKTAINGNLHNLLDEILKSPQCQNCKTATAGVMGYISKYRNAAHHPPKSRKQAHTKYKECRHGFLDGIKQIKNFRDAFKTNYNINVCIVNF